MQGGSYTNLSPCGMFEDDIALATKMNNYRR